MEEEVRRTKEGGREEQWREKGWREDEEGRSVRMRKRRGGDNVFF